MSGFIHADLGANGTVEVVAASVDPGAVGSQLHNGDVVGISHGLTGISFLNGVDTALAFDAERTVLGKVGTVGREVIVHEELHCSHALGQ